MFLYASVGYLGIAMSRRSMSTVQKLDELIKSVSALQKAHGSSHKEFEGKLRKLETDVATSQELQEDETERPIKRLKMKKPYEFHRKGHKEQYCFNSDVSEHVATATNTSVNFTLR